MFIVMLYILVNVFILSAFNQILENPEQGPPFIIKLRIINHYCHHIKPVTGQGEEAWKHEVSFNITYV